MITVYIASPYSVGDMAINVRNSILVADRLLELGFAPLVPLLSHYWHIVSPKSYDTWMNLDKEWVKRCDCVLRLPGESKGADVEVALAQEMNIPVFFSVGDLIDYFQEFLGETEDRMGGL